MHLFFSILAIIICLLSVVGVHEFGHALAAKLFGVKIRRITLGFGRPLLKFPMGSTSSFELCTWPLGGRVHLYNTKVGEVSLNDHPFCFDKKPIWMRIIILLAGSFANILAAFLALLFMMMLGFKQMPSTIDAVATPSPAATAGLKAHERITAVAGKKTDFWRDVSMQFLMHVGENNVPITVCMAKGPCRQTALDLRLWQNKPHGFSLFEALGIQPDISPNHVEQVKGVSFWQACVSAKAQLFTLLSFLVIMIKQIFTHHIPFAALLGPFKFFQAIIDSFFQGLAIFLYFIANFSVAMALVNLLPIPGLDGGSILYGMIEKIRGRPISVALEILIYRLLMILFALILVQLILNDLRFYVGT